MCSSDLRQGYSPVHSQERPQERRQERREETDQGRLSNRERLAIGCVTAVILGVNHIFFTFPRCIDNIPNPLLSGHTINTENIETVKELLYNGYLIPTGDGYNPTRKLVDSLSTDTNLTESLKKLGIDTNPEGFTSVSCPYTWGELLADVSTGHAVETCGFHQQVSNSAPCAVLRQEQGSPRRKIGRAHV
mgnify:CR=1 FL=1